MKHVQEKLSVRMLLIGQFFTFFFTLAAQGFCIGLKPFGWDFEVSLE